jgi:hypothetical protein
VRIDRRFVVVIILAHILLKDVETCENRLFDKRRSFNNEGPFLITETAAPDEAPQSLNPRVRG